MVAQKFLLICGWTILCMVVSVGAQDHGVYATCQGNVLRGVTDEHEFLCKQHLASRVCYEKAGYTEKQIVNAIEHARESDPRRKTCGSATATFSIAIGIATFYAIRLLKLGVMSHS
ncbi:hypothetical protein DdX_19646 [Ditylenchus destructor]|uniref:Uncharacterized protein n=1 Tax=Ditylenchus destructor TaxID=166010 RepID=A0AAD4MJ45_9BILA|nr:hypothetical protein DdX_19646 [Ditylenchus destructor]